jgi:hypothetical protein
MDDKKALNKELIKEKFYSRKELILARIDRISPSSLKRHYTRNLFRVTYLLSVSIIFILLGSYFIYEKNTYHAVYVSNLKGRVVEYQRTPERVETIKRTLRARNEK